MTRVNRGKAITDRARLWASLGETNGLSKLAKSAPADLSKGQYWEGIGRDDVNRINGMPSKAVANRRETDVGTGRWHKGLPSMPGWYNASSVRRGHTMRWFDGERWSIGCLPSDTAENAAAIAAVPYPAVGADDIEWRRLHQRFAIEITKGTTVHGIGR